MNIDLELALIRWAIVSRQWFELSSGAQPYLPAFLCGWHMRQLDIPLPDSMDGCGTHPDSLRAGYRECDNFIKIS